MELSDEARDLLSAEAVDPLLATIVATSLIVLIIAIPIASVLISFFQKLGDCSRNMSSVGSSIPGSTLSAPSRALCGLGDPSRWSSAGNWRRAIT
jgi:hypothetical protein